MRIMSFLALFVAVMLAIIIGKFFGESWVNWRLVDTIAILCGGSGFFAIAGEAARLAPFIELPYKIGYAVNWLDASRRSVELLPKIIGIKFERTSASPPNFEEDQRQHDRVRPWAQEVTRRILALNPQELPELTLASIPEFPAGITDEIILDERNKVHSIIETYTQRRAEALDAKRRLERTSLEEVFIFVSPLLVAAAVGLTLFKALYGPLS
jgi:hypothetical protein